jgi:hypothetical protein
MIHTHQTAPTLFSIGGMVAQEIALEAPDFVRKLPTGWVTSMQAPGVCSTGSGQDLWTRQTGLWLMATCSRSWCSLTGFPGTARPTQACLRSPSRSPARAGMAPGFSDSEIE